MKMHKNKMIWSRKNSVGDSHSVWAHNRVCLFVYESFCLHHATVWRNNNHVITGGSRDLRRGLDIGSGFFCVGGSYVEKIELCTLNPKEPHFILPFLTSTWGHAAYLKLSQLRSKCVGWSTSVLIYTVAYAKRTAIIWTRILWRRHLFISRDET